MPLDQFPPQLQSSVLIKEAADDRKPSSKGTKMQYILTGFTHDVGFRVFAFEGIGKDRVRVAFSVKVDLVLIRKYGIRMQELPLLCKRVLEQRDGEDTVRSFTYTEAAMSLLADANAAEAAAQKRKPPPKPPTENAGAAWRNP